MSEQTLAAALRLLGANVAFQSGADRAAFDALVDSLDPAPVPDAPASAETAPAADAGAVVSSPPAPAPTPDPAPAPAPVPVVSTDPQTSGTL